MVYLKVLLGGLAGLVVAYLLTLTWTIYRHPKTWNAMAGGPGTFWLGVCAVGFALGCYLGAR